MAAELRLLVVEGNIAETRAQQTALSGASASQSYAAVLRSIAPDAAIDICFPADGAALPQGKALADYDGVAITGSALNLWKAEPASLNQIELAREVFASRVPFFGSCWGLQVAAVAAGGEVRLNPKGREIGFARKITLTEVGRTHALHRGRPLAFDAPTVHSDIVTRLPDDITVTAGNGMAEVQGAEIRHLGGVFWGVQYHPEYSLYDVAMTFKRYKSRLLDDALFATEADLEAHIGELLALHGDPARKGAAWRLGIDQDVLDQRARLTELSSWISDRVLPERSRRGRA